MNNYYRESKLDYSAFPTDIRNILSQVHCFQNKQLSKSIKDRLEKDNLIKHWIKIVGPKLAEHTKPISIQDQKIIVAVDEPKWMFVIQQSKKQLAEKINEFIKFSNKRSVVDNQENSEALLKKQENTYTMGFILKKIPFSVYPSHNISIIKADLDREKIIKIEHILNPIKNNEKLKQVFHTILVKYYQNNQNSEVNKKPI